MTPAAATLVVPWDEAAEQILVGCAVATAHGAARGHELDLADLYRPAHRRLIEAARQLGDIRPVLMAGAEMTLSSTRIRVAAVATMTDTPIETVARMVDVRPAMWWSHGAQRQVEDAARRRQVMAAAADVFNALGAGAALEDVAVPLAELAVAS